MNSIPDGLQYAFLAATGGFFGWFAVDAYYWLKNRKTRPGDQE